MHSGLRRLIREVLADVAELLALAEQVLVARLLDQAAQVASVQDAPQGSAQEVTVLGVHGDRLAVQGLVQVGGDLRGERPRGRRDGRRAEAVAGEAEAAPEDGRLEEPVVETAQPCF